MRLTRPALGLALVGLMASLSFAYADEAPKTTATSKTLFLSQDGCGAAAGPGRLETTARTDGADGCGTIGGLPVNEVLYKVNGRPSYTDYTSTSKMPAFLMDGTKKITGQIAAGSWAGGGGVGNIDIDVRLVGRTSAGKSIELGETKASAPASPGIDIAYVPFSLSVPASANGQTFTSFVFSLAVHGANFGMSAKQFSGESFVVLPAKVPPPKKPAKR